MALYDIYGNPINNDGSSLSANTELALHGIDPTPKNAVTATMYNPVEFPLMPCMGNEYLNGWYKKLFYGQHVIVAVDGDSTTQEEYLYMNPAKRAQIIEKIMKLGGHTNYTVHKNGNGSKATGDYVGRYYSSDMFSSQTGSTPTATSHPNGLLATTMAQNPDLIIFGYGLNDYNRYRSGANGALWDSSENLDLQGRLDLFKLCVEEFLQRLRGAVGTTVNGRECYGKDEYDTAVILCVPISRAEDEKWSYYCRKMIKDLARQYHCGVFDPTIVNYDHTWSDAWSTNPQGRADGTHPAPWTNADFMSAIQPLLYPMGLWFSSDESLHSATYNLTNCTLSYTPDKLRTGVKLQTVITADDGFTVGSVEVTHNGNVVSNAYTESTGTIQISNISGDVVITATAS